MQHSRVSFLWASHCFIYVHCGTFARMRNNCGATTADQRFLRSLYRTTYSHVPEDPLTMTLRNRLAFTTNLSQRMFLLSQRLFLLSQRVFLFPGPLLPPDSDVHNVPLVRSRGKQLLVASILDSFSNLLPSATYLRTNIDTGMGFILGNMRMWRDASVVSSGCNRLEQWSLLWGVHTPRGMGRYLRG
jgi:hypothetical protein